MRFVTTYALTKGILAVEDGDWEEASGYLYWGPYRTQAKPGDWFKTAGDAEDRAKKMQDARIASLEKSIAKMRKKTIRIMPAPRKDD